MQRLDVSKDLLRLLRRDHFKLVQRPAGHRAFTLKSIPRPTNFIKTAQLS
jgi:hypothetical protein